MAAAMFRWQEVMQQRRRRAPHRDQLHHQSQRRHRWWMSVSRQQLQHRSPMPRRVMG